MTQFYGKTKICYGENALETLEELAVKQAFIVTDPFMVKVGFIDHIKSHLNRGHIPYRLFDGVEPDPSLESVTKATRLFMESGADCVVALGGGSALDMAKAVVFFAYKARGGQKPLMIAIPTTSGTGSEVTAISVVTDKVNEVKIPLNDDLLIPDMAILDARFTRSLPPSVTGVTGTDVLTHAIEAYTSRRANSFTDIYAEQAVRYVFRYLLRAYTNGDDMEARRQMLLASCMAGMAFNNSGLGITHSIAHSLGGLFHVPHGLANAVVLPYVMRFNSFDAGVKYRDLAAMLGLPAATVEEGVTSLVTAVRELNTAMNIPGRVGALKVEEAAYKANQQTIASNVLHDICTEGNPRKPSHDDICGLLEKIW